MAHMMNATLEDYETQCISRHFSFPHREVVKVPDQYAKPLYQQLRSKGIFIIPDRAPLDDNGNPKPGWNIETAKKEAEFESLKQYKLGRLKSRINNYNLQKDEFKKRGVTLRDEDFPGYQEALRWDAEISELLNAHSPIKEYRSFKDLGPKQGSKEEAELGFETASANLPEIPNKNKKAQKKLSFKDSIKDEKSDGNAG